MSENSLKIALYGVGSMGSFHARVISENPRCTLAYIVDNDVESAYQVSNQYGATQLKNNGEILAVDGVVIATPTDTHFEIARSYLESGIPVLVEKPISRNFHEVKMLIELAKMKKVTFKCGFVERFNPVVIKALEIVRAPIHFASVRHSPYVPRIHTPVTGDLLIHDLDICIQIFEKDGMPRISSAVPAAKSGQTSSSLQMINLTLVFPNQHSASLSASRLDHQKKRSIQIFEEDRTLELDLLQKTIAIYRSVSNQTIEKGLGDQLQTIIEIPQLQYAHEPLAAQFENFLNCIFEYNTENEELDLLSYRSVHDLISIVDEGVLCD